MPGMCKLERRPLRSGAGANGAGKGASAIVILLHRNMAYIAASKDLAAGYGVSDRCAYVTEGICRIWSYLLGMKRLL
jgi:hypothetical protein